MAKPQLVRVVDAAGDGAPALHTRVGRIADIHDGRVRVDVPGAGAPIAARVALSGPVPPHGELIGAPVLLAFDNGDLQRPIVVGFVRETLPAPSDTLELDARVLSLEGREQLELRCGEASIVLRADGSLVIKGTRVTSRAAETHKIRGATVLIN